MTETLCLVVYAVLIGAGATAFMDIVAVARQRLNGAAMPDYAAVGRWLAEVARGRFLHDSIAALPRVRGERAIGWSAHYLTGIAFASMLLAGWGLDWVRHPTLAPALGVGIGSVVAPFLLMQPGMGAGIAARRAPHPGAARLRSIVTHATFAVGLYVAGWIASMLAR